MSRGKGNQAPAWVASYLQPWYPGCEKTPNSRPGRDILGTPGVAFEVKTSGSWRSGWLRQAALYARDGEISVLVYLPPGTGEQHVAAAQAVLPLRALMGLLVQAGYAPPPAGAP